MEIFSTANIDVTKNFISLISRVQDFNSAYNCSLANGLLVTGRSVGGIPTNLASTAFTTIHANATAKMSFLTDGSSLSCKIEQNGNTYQVDAVDTTYSSGKVGLFANSGTKAFDFYADNFKVEVLQ